MRRYPNYTYLSLTTREAINVGHKVYIQDLITSGQLEERLGRPARPGAHARLPVRQPEDDRRARAGHEHRRASVYPQAARRHRDSEQARLPDGPAERKIEGEHSLSRNTGEDTAAGVSHRREGWLTTRHCSSARG